MASSSLLFIHRHRHRHRHRHCHRHCYSHCHRHRPWFYLFLVIDLVVVVVVFWIWSKISFAWSNSNMHWFSKMICMNFVISLLSFYVGSCFLSNVATSQLVKWGNCKQCWTDKFSNFCWQVLKLKDAIFSHFDKCASKI